MAQTAALAAAFVLLIAGGANAIVCDGQCTTVSASGYPHSNFYKGIVRICEGTFSETTGASECRTQIGTGAIRGNNNHKIFTSKDVYDDNDESIVYHIGLGNDVFALTTEGHAAKLTTQKTIKCDTAAVSVQQRSDGQYMPADSAFYPPGKWGRMNTFNAGDDCNVFGWDDGQLKYREIDNARLRSNKNIIAGITTLLQHQDAGAPIICKDDRNAADQDWHIEGAGMGDHVWGTKQC